MHRAIRVCVSLVMTAVALSAGPRAADAGGAAGTAAARAANAVSKAARAARRPSIFLLTIDTARGDEFGFSGYPREVAPFLDSLATGAIVYRNAWSTSSWTVPAVTSLLTGLYPHSHGVVHGAISRGVAYDQEVVSESFRMLPQELKDLGYRTYGVVSNAHLASAMGYGRGFDRYLSLPFSPADSVNQALLKWKADILSGEGPVFIWVHYYDPHHPYTQHEPWFGQQVRVTPADSRLLRMAKALPPVPPRSESGDRKRFAELARALYDSEIRWVDEHVRQLYREIPRLDSCLTIITADHGEEFFDHGYLGHCRSLYAETARVPFLLRFPGGTRSGVSRDLVSLIDVPTTLVRAAGGTPPAAWAGVSLVEAAGMPPGSAGRGTGAAPTSGGPGVAGLEPIQGGPAFADRAVFAELNRNAPAGLMEALIGARWKVMVNRLKGTREFYDLAADPLEKMNLLAVQAGRADSLFLRLDRFIQALPPPPAVVEVKALPKETEVQLRGQGYIR